VRDWESRNAPAYLLGLEDDDLESFHPQLGNYGAFVTATGFDANPPGMAINSHVEFALSGIDSGANKR
jgi:hypothetical protein